MTIEVEPKSLYGRTCYYPLNNLAKAVCEVLGRKTLTERQFKIFKKHNISVEEVSDESDQ